MILLIDNYDSFSYNLYQLVGSVNSDIKVVRNDEISIEELKILGPTHIVLSPGPGKPSDTGICMDIVKKLGSSVSILGVCIGHQVICEAYGGVISYANELMHGKKSTVELDVNNYLFRGLPDKIEVARYHSLELVEETLPNDLIVTARTLSGEIMAVGHKEYNVNGLQFHPESILTQNGKDIIKNFLEGI